MLPTIEAFKLNGFDPSFISTYFVLGQDIGGVCTPVTQNGTNITAPADLTWLSFDSATGLMSGTPQATNAGTYNLCLQVFNGQGGDQYDVDVDGGATNLVNDYFFTLTVPTDIAPGIGLDPIGVNGYMTTASAISGTATDITPNLKRVDLQIMGDGKHWNGTNFVTTTGDPAWVTVWADAEGDESNTSFNTGPSNPEGKDTTVANFESGITYTVNARAVDAGGNTASTSDVFIFFNDTPTPMSLNVELAATSILSEGQTAAQVTLQTLLQTQPDLSGLPLTLTITDPSSNATVLNVVTENSSGQVSLTLGTGEVNNISFSEPGDWIIEAEFAGPPNYPEYDAVTSSSALLRVGSSAGYAVLVQGKVTGDTAGQAAHNKTLNRVYRTMKRRNISDFDISYFNHDVTQDADENGIPDNLLSQQGKGVDALPVKASIQATIEQDLAYQVRNNPGPVWIVLHDHGTLTGGDSSFFELDGTEVITPSELDSWVSTLENDIRNESSPGADDAVSEDQAPIIIVNGSCYSGAFIPGLSAPGRIIVASANDNEAGYQGPVESDGVRVGSYMLEALFDRLDRGWTLDNAFRSAVDQTEEYTRISDDLAPNEDNGFLDTAAQHPLLDDNADGVGSNELLQAEGLDGDVSDGIKLGVDPAATNSATFPAEIATVTPATFLNPVTSQALLTMTSTNNDDVIAPLIEVRRPNTTLTAGEITLPSEPALQLTTDNLYLGDFLAVPNTSVPGCPVDTFCLNYGAVLDPTKGGLDQFNDPGTYEVHYYVKDKDTKDLSEKRVSYVYKDSVSNLPPAAPTLVSPAPGATDQPVAVYMSWNAVTDPNGDRLTYTVRISETADMLNVVYEQDRVPYTSHVVPKPVDTSAPILLNDATYHWQVEVIDEFGGRATSPVQSFTTDSDAGNNNYGLINGLIRSNVTSVALTNLSITALPGSGTYVNGGSVGDPLCQPTISEPRCTILNQQPDGSVLYTMYTAPNDKNFQDPLGFDVVSSSHASLANPPDGFRLAATETLLNQNITLSASATTVAIDIDGFTTGTGNGGSKALHPHHTGFPTDDLVAAHVFGSASFDVTDMPASGLFKMKLGPGEAEATSMGPPEAINGDGYDDRKVYFYMSEMGLDNSWNTNAACLDKELTLVGREKNTAGGEPFAGTDTDLTCSNQAQCH